MEKENIANLSTIDALATTIDTTNSFFLEKAQKQVNTALSLRNWLIGYYIVTYEQSGKDRAEYGSVLLKVIAKRLLNMGIHSLGERNLYLCRDFYHAYPQTLQTASAKSYLIDFQHPTILQTVSAKFNDSKLDLLLTHLSFSHFIELLKVNNRTARDFYENESIRNSWSVRVLKRAVDSLLFERTGMSTDKIATLKEFESLTENVPETIFRNTYLLEFLGLEDKTIFTEGDLEERIITNLQHFLLELGRGFCFEHRQRRITFDNKHYHIDLVFYHRILKCHVLLDLKIGEFDHGDAGQMNMYLNYYKENESDDSDKAPIGIILCSGKNEALVKYATMGLSQQVFVSKYLVNLPSELQLKEIVAQELAKN